MFKAFMKNLMNRMFSAPENGGNLLLGSSMDPELFVKEDATFDNATTIMDFTGEKSPKQRVTLTDNIGTALQINCPAQKGRIMVEILQDATGSRTIAAWNAFKSDGSTAVTIEWLGGSAVTHTATADNLDKIEFFFDGTTLWHQASKQAYDLS